MFSHNSKHPIKRICQNPKRPPPLFLDFNRLCIIVFNPENWLKNKILSILSKSDFCKINIIFCLAVDDRFYICSKYLFLITPPPPQLFIMTSIDWKTKFCQNYQNLRSTKLKLILLFYLEVDDRFNFLQISDFKLYLTKAKK